MKRRSFVKNIAIAAGTSAVVPAWLLSCRKKVIVPELTACGIQISQSWYREQNVVEVASHSELNSLNLVSWPDSLIGFVKSPSDGKFYGFGFGDSGDIMRARFSDDGYKIEEGIRVPMKDTTGNWTGSGGPVYFDENSGILIMVTHHEKYDPSNPNFFAHVTLRMAKSTDFGQTWSNLGTIIDHNCSDETDPNKALVMGNGGFVIKNDEGVDYMYVYHNDIQGTGIKNQLAVSRASLSHIIQSAKENKTPIFNKWNGVDWSQPGLGGTSVDLMPNFSTWGVVGDFDPYFSMEMKKFVAFYPSQIRGDVNPPTWNVLCSISEDGIKWEPATKLYINDISGGDPIYTGIRAHNRILEGCEAILYRMFCTDTTSRWEFNKLDRVDIAITRK